MTSNTPLSSASQKLAQKMYKGFRIEVSYLQNILPISVSFSGRHNKSSKVISCRYVEGKQNRKKGTKKAESKVKRKSCQKWVIQLIRGIDHSREFADACKFRIREPKGQFHHKFDQNWSADGQMVVCGNECLREPRVGNEIFPGSHVGKPF